ncbi:hypothetical protein EMMF5_004720 [Cystobasidiomycetes sp. EMM_F5]
MADAPTGLDDPRLTDSNVWPPATPYEATMLMVPLAIAALVNAIEVAIYACTQDRSVDGFSYYRAADVAAPVLTGAAGVTSQIILTLRCYKVVKRGMLVLTLLGIGLCASFSGAIWMTVSAYPLMGPDAASLDTTNIYYASELWLWSSVGVDLAITGLLSVHLRALKQGFSSRTDGYVNSMIRLTFETFLVPTIVNIAAAVIYIATYQNYVLINWSLLAQPCIPSLYLFSLVYCIEGTTARQRGLVPGFTSENGSTRVSKGAKLGSLRHPTSSSSRSGEGIFQIVQAPELAEERDFRPARDAHIRRNNKPAVQITSMATSSWDAPETWESTIQLGPSNDYSDIEAQVLEKV